MIRDLRIFLKGEDGGRAFTSPFLREVSHAKNLFKEKIEEEKDRKKEKKSEKKKSLSELSEHYYLIRKAIENLSPDIRRARALTATQPSPSKGKFRARPESSPSTPPYRKVVQTSRARPQSKAYALKQTTRQQARVAAGSRIAQQAKQVPKAPGKLSNLAKLSKVSMGKAGLVIQAVKKSWEVLKSVRDISKAFAGLDVTGEGPASTVFETTNEVVTDIEAWKEQIERIKTENLKRLRMGGTVDLSTTLGMKQVIKANKQLDDMREIWGNRRAFRNAMGQLAGLGPTGG